LRLNVKVYSVQTEEFLSKYNGMTINLKHINFAFPNGGAIFKDFSLCLDGNTANPVAILGGSGCGKTTLLRLIAGLLKPQSGSITFGGDSPSYSSSSSSSSPPSPAVSFVFQEPRLLPHLTVLQNVMLPIEKLDTKRARRFLALTGLESYADSYPNELSGGQAQRASIARAWAYPAPLVILDEPFQSLDIPLRISLMDSVLDLLHDTANTEKRFVISVTHDPREAIYLAKRIIVLGANQDKSTGVLLDEITPDCGGQREFISAGSIELEKKLIAAL
jgi:NitT/TauT family transport system ATP-binding protein